MNHTIHRVVGLGRVAIILSWAAFLAFAWYTTKYPHPGKAGRLEIINPSYRWLSLASAAALVCVGAALLPARRDPPAHRHGSDEEGDHDHEETGLAASCCQEAPSPGEFVFQALFLVPIVLSLCASGGGLSQTSLGRRGVHEIQPPTPSEIRSAATTATAAGRPLSMTDFYEYLLMGAPGQLVGRDVDLVGQYFVDDRCGENQFIVTRIVVTCCLADAEVIGLRVQSAKPFKPGTWIAVRGKLKIWKDRSGNRAICVDDATVSETPPPGDILLYPRQRRAPW